MSTYKLIRASIFLSLISLFISLTRVVSAETKPNQNLYCLGHINPDTDAIISVLAAADLFGCTPVRAGKINPETKFVLNKFNLIEPELITENNPEKRYILIDFNDKSQLFPGIDSTQIIKVIDHHGVSGSFAGPSSPIDITVRPWGSSCTVLWSLYREAKMSISKNIAAGMLGAIISDTLNLTSPTTTIMDRDAYSDLTQISSIQDISNFVAEQFHTKSQTSNLDADTIIKQDYKTYGKPEAMFGISVAETIYPQELLSRKKELLQAMAELKNDSKILYIFFFIVNPQNKESTLLILSEKEANLAKLAFDADIQNDQMNTSPRVSRKKEFVPPLEKAISNIYDLGSCKL